MSKGSERRPGDGYQDAWELIFGKKPPAAPVPPKEKPNDVRPQ